ncbi:MAG TPA: hypothetical protein IGS53_21005 [Leptolyngbyaceae cyanobacterium M33_DOE_097]|nr:hypothetical protein [Leptolyngbyaceae cyanobacterium M33_DOE_097]
MTRSLYPLFQAIASAPTEAVLRDRFMDGVSEYFGVQRFQVNTICKTNIKSFLN